MSNDQSASGSSAATDAQQGQRPNSTSTTADSGASGASTSPTADDIKNPEAKKHADDAAAQRLKVRELETELKKFRDERQAAEDAKLSEQEKLQKKLAELQRTHDDKVRTEQERVMRFAVRAAATERGLNPALAAKVIDYAAIEFDDDGDPKNLEKLLDKAVTEFGLTVGQASAPTGGSVGAPARSSTGQTLVTQAQLNDYAFLDNWEKTHGGQKFSQALMKGEVRVLNG